MATLNGMVRWASLRKQHLSEDWKKVKELMIQRVRVQADERRASAKALG